MKEYHFYSIAPLNLTKLGQLYNLNEDRNWISNASYDLDGNIISASVSYFNTLGKATQSQSWDIKTGKVWASEVRYDGWQPVFSTLSSPEYTDTNQTLY